MSFSERRKTSQMARIKVKIVWLVALLNFFVLCQADEQVFSLMGSKVLRAGQDYQFTVTANTLNSTLSASYTFSGVDRSNNIVNLDIKNQEILSNSINSYTFNTKTFGSGEYDISYTVFDPTFDTIYADSHKIVYVAKKYSVFIHTDKALYKGGDIVEFSIFAIDSETIPINVAGSTITIKDPSGTKIKVFDENTFIVGKYKNTFQLSDESVLGQWTIVIESDGEISTKYFEVQEFVLPTFSVALDLPSQVAIPDTTFRVKVTAEYTFGSSVKGVAVVTFYRNVFVWLPYPKPETTPDPSGDSSTSSGEPLPVLPPVRSDSAIEIEPISGGGPSYEKSIIYSVTVNIDGASASFDVDMAKDLGITGYDYISVDVDFTEELTSKTISATKTMSFMPYAYEIVFVGDNYYAPNSNYSYKIFVRKIADKTPAPLNTSITVLYSFPYTCSLMSCQSNTIQATYYTDATGMASAEVAIGSYQYVSMQISSPISQQGWGFAQTQMNYVADVLELVLVTPNPRLNSIATVEVKTSDNSLTSCFYSMISKGITLATNKLTFVNRSAAFSFTVNFNHAPTLDIIAFFYDASGKIVSKTLTIALNEELPNYLNLTLETPTVKPGENAILKINSILNSTVTCFAIDLASQLAKDGNSFKKADILNDVSIYNYRIYDWWDWWAWSDGFQDDQNFENINIFVMKATLYDPNEPKTSTLEPTTPDMFTQPGFPGEETAGTTSANVIGPVLPGGDGGTGEITTSIPEPIERKNFFESISFIDVNVTTKKQLGPNLFDNVNGEARINFQAPDSITSYIISGVSMHSSRGMGISEVDPSLKIFQPFFLQVTLPHQVKRRETVAQSINIFSFLSKAQTVTVSLKANSTEFSVITPEAQNWTLSNGSYTQRIYISPSKPKSVKIFIRPKTFGIINLKISAVGVLAGDAVVKPLKVIPEGIAKSVTNSTMFIKKSKTGTVTAQLTCTLPQTAIVDTTSVTATVVGDIMGNAFSNLENLIQMSYGCGEQNMLNFVPNIVALRYLDSIGQITSTLRAKAIAYAESGYQQEMTYRRTDYSFSAFGNSDTVGSTWLTTYVVKSFIWAKPYIVIDPIVIETGLSYIISKQNGNGSFREDGNVIHKELQGGSAAGVAMTAYISILFSENLADYPQYQSARDSAIDYVAANYDPSDVYASAIVSYALFLANHSSFNTAYSQFYGKRNETSQFIRWEKPSLTAPDPNNWWWFYQPHSNDIETTAYGLWLIQNFDLAKSIKIAKYLITKKNEFGGYGSSQDTVVALTALAGFSAITRSSTGTLALTLQPDRGSSFTASVTASNAMTVREYILQPLVRKLNITSGTNSNGSAIVTLTCNFYELNPQTKPRFLITHNFTKACKGLLKSEICVSYIAVGDDFESNMALVKYTFLSGYIYDNSLSLPDIVKRIDKSDGDTTIELYFDSFNATPTCITIQALQTSVVDTLKPATIEVSDYYDTTKRADVLYPAPSNLPDCKNLTT